MPSLFHLFSIVTLGLRYLLSPLKDVLYSTAIKSNKIDEFLP